MIKVGDSLPSVAVQVMQDGKMLSKDINELLAGKCSVLFGVPGAFTPTCSEKHLPGYLGVLFDFKKAGIEQVACISVNDAYVMLAWAKSQNITNEILMLADGSAEFAHATGLQLDLTKQGFGMRCVRFAMVVQDGVVRLLNVENGGALQVSKAEVVLADWRKQ
ncbi:MAG: peroxiredoxin [Gammaproteobacteria bacterium]|nr:peroxiredoxin [Gammaproteobacteria bacterium]